MLRRMALDQRSGLWRPGVWIFGSLQVFCLSTAGLLFTTLAAPAQPGSASFDPSVSLAKHVNLAAQYWEQGNFSKAKDEYRKALYYSPNFVGFLEGVINCSEQTKDWSEVADAADRIFVLAPEKKVMYEYDYGMALFYLNRYQDAVPHLKNALAAADIPMPAFKPLKINADDAHISTMPDLLPSEQPVKANPADSSKPLPGDSPTVTSSSPVDHMGHELLTYDNAITAESIVIAEYASCDKTDNVRYNSPPIAHYRIMQFLKGPPLNRALPIRYQFHTQYDLTVPAGWKFEANLLPDKGSKWILFVEPAVPERGAFNTFCGSFGRQPATQANLDKLDQLLDSHNMKLLQ
jgi:hypothetical protein